MSKTQRMSLVVLLLGLFLIQSTSAPFWFVTFLCVFGYIGFVSDAIERRLMMVLFSVVWWGGWVYRRARGLPEPKAKTS